MDPLPASLPCAVLIYDSPLIISRYSNLSRSNQSQSLDSLAILSKRKTRSKRSSRSSATTIRIHPLQPHEVCFELVKPFPISTYTSSSHKVKKFVTLIIVVNDPLPGFVPLFSFHGC